MMYSYSYNIIIAIATYTTMQKCRNAEMHTNYIYDYIYDCIHAAFKKNIVAAWG